MRTAAATACVAFALIAGCDDDDDPAESVPPSTQSADTATAWFALQLQLVQQTPGWTPPVASRAFAYSGITLYESIVPGMADHQSLVGTLPGLTVLPQPRENEPYWWPAAANHAMAAITRDLFANATAANVAAIDALEAELDASYAKRVGPQMLERSAAYGEAVAAAIYEWSLTDGGNEGYLHNFPMSYVPPTGAGMWVPTPPMFQPAMQPYWGTNRTFCLRDLATCEDAGPPPFSTEPGTAFYGQAQEVYQTSRTLSRSQIEIAQFWSDDPVKTSTPPGHSISITTQVIEQTGVSLDVAAEAYAKVGIAVSDAFVACWADKFHYNLMRPITYIRENIDERWMPLLSTPPFPEYSSGHSTQSAAMAEVLTGMFGILQFTDRTGDARGFAPRTYPSFFAAAEEAAISRLYGGIHYRAAIEDGLVMGRCVGDCVNAMPFTP